jgi:membrane protein
MVQTGSSGSSPVPRDPAISAPDPSQPPESRPALRRRRTLARLHHRLRRRWREARGLIVIVGHELIRTRVLDVAGGVAFWAMLSMIPLLMAVVALISILPLPGLPSQLLAVAAILVPPQSLTLVGKLAGSLLTPHRGALSFGVIGYIWSTTGGFTALIAALDIAYDVKIARSWLHNRIRALILTFTSGGLITVSLLALLAGPHLLHLIDEVAPIPPAIEKLWPLLRTGTVAICFVFALELIYFLAPNMRQRFVSTLPGAVFAMTLTFAGSCALAFYLDRLSGYSRLYGGMGAIIGLMFWIYLVALAILIGAEMNAEIAKRRDSLFRRHVQSVWGKGGVPRADPSAPASGRPAA